MRTRSILLTISLWGLGLAACGGAPATRDAPTGAADAPSGDPDAADDAIPTEPAALQAWLAARRYEGWPAESARHPSAGPHGGSVRTFVSPSLAASLAAGTDHPRGAAAVKELYGSGTTVTGWAVSVKLADDSADGANWYWYEAFSTEPDAEADYEGQGLELCTDCHGAGEDQILIPFPLQ